MTESGDEARSTHENSKAKWWSTLLDLLSLMLMGWQAAPLRQGELGKCCTHTLCRTMTTGARIAESRQDVFDNIHSGNAGVVLAVQKLDRKQNLAGVITGHVTKDKKLVHSVQLPK